MALRTVLSAALVTLTCTACHRVMAVREPAGACPAITPAGTPVPFMEYVTWVVDGKVVAWRTRQQVNGAHSTTSLDTVPAVDNAVKKAIKSMGILPTDSARLFDRCPGVRVVSIHR